MAPRPDDTWPDRPDDFYDDWSVFCSEALSARLKRGGRDDELAVVLLAAGAILGSAGLLDVVIENKAAIDRKGREWGVPDLSKIAGIGGAILGATAGGLSIAWLTRTLGRHADTEQVNALQTRLSTARREFETLENHCREKRLPHVFHRAAVEHLFTELTQRT